MSVKSKPSTGRQASGSNRAETIGTSGSRCAARAVLARARGRSGHGVADAAHGVVVEPLEHVERRQVLVDLIDPAGARDHAGDVRVAGAPGDGELGERAAEVIGNGGQPAYLVVAARVGQQVAQPL